MKELLENLIKQAILAEFGEDISQGVVFSVAVPPKPEMGDYATNVALILAKKVGQSPKEVAERIVESGKWKVSRIIFPMLKY